jgi:tetratricopeptide (TPR) repeat protein
MQSKWNPVIAIIVVIAIAFSLFLIVPLGGSVGLLREATISFIFRKAPRFISLDVDVEGVPQVVKAGESLKIKGGETIIITGVHANTFFSAYLTADVEGFGKQNDLNEPIDTAEIRDQLMKAGIRSVPIDIYYINHKIAKVPLEIELAEQDFLDQLKAAKSDEEKISILKSAHANFPQDGYFLEMLDKILSAKENYQGLVDIFKEVIESDPANMVAYANLSRYYIKLGQFDEALAMCQKIVDAGKADAEVYRRMAYIAGEKGDFDNRVAYLKKALELDKRNDSVILDLAKTYEQAGHVPEALDVYNSVSGTTTDKEILIPLIEDSLKKQDNKKAVELLKRYIHYYPQDKNAVAQLGMVMGRMGDTKSQTAYYQKALELSPNDPVLWYNLGVARGKEGDQKGALDAFAKVLQIRPDDTDSLVSAATISLKLGKFKEAYGYYVTLVKKTGKKEHMKGLVSAAVGMKDSDKIIDACTQYLKRNSDYEVALTLAYAYEDRASKGDISKKIVDNDAALDAYKTALKINPQSKIAKEKIPELRIENLKLRKNLQ